MRIVFAGTPEFAVPPLKALIASGHEVIAAYTQPDRPQGRGRKVTGTPVKCIAEAAGIPVYQPLSFKVDGAIEQLRSLAPDLMVVVAYGLILPKDVIDIPPKGCINIHASLLPRWRGAAPIQRSILEGDRETGVTIMYIEPKLDAGPMILKATTPIGLDETASELHDRLSVIGAETLMKSLPAIDGGNVRAELQDEAKVTYAAKISKEEGLLDFTQPAESLARRVRAFNAWPVAETRYQGNPLRIWRADATCEPSDHPPGILHMHGNDLLISTGQGSLRILELQLPGGRRISARDFTNTRPGLPTPLGGT